MTASPQISLREVYQVPVLCVKTSGKVRQIGRIDDVLFDPDKLRAVGFSLKGRFRSRCLAREALAPAFSKEGERVLELVSDAKLGRAPEGADRSFRWDRTVILQGLPVYTTEMERLGKVSDARIDWEDGTLVSLEVSAGLASDATLGKRTLPAHHVLRFIEAQQEEAPHVLMVDAAARTCDYAGGLASAAGKVSGKVDVAAGRVARKVRESDAAQAAHTRAKEMWQGFSEGYEQGRHWTDEES